MRGEFGGCVLVPKHGFCFLCRPDRRDGIVDAVEDSEIQVNATVIPEQNVEVTKGDIGGQLTSLKHTLGASATQTCDVLLHMYYEVWGCMLVANAHKVLLTLLPPVLQELHPRLERIPPMLLLQLLQPSCISTLQPLILRLRPNTTKIRELANLAI